MRAERANQWRDLARHLPNPHTRIEATVLLAFALLFLVVGMRDMFGARGWFLFGLVVFLAGAYMAAGALRAIRDRR